MESLGSILSNHVTTPDQVPLTPVAPARRCSVPLLMKNLKQTDIPLNSSNSLDFSIFLVDGSSRSDDC